MKKTTLQVLISLLTILTISCCILCFRVYALPQEQENTDPSSRPQISVNSYSVSLSRSGSKLICRVIVQKNSSTESGRVTLRLINKSGDTLDSVSHSLSSVRGYLKYTHSFQPGSSGTFRAAYKIKIRYSGGTETLSGKTDAVKLP